MHRFTLLGWTWPLVRQLVQLAVLVFLFSRVLHLGIHNYAAFVFIGLIGWGWFASGVGSAANSLSGNRHLVFQARFPDVVLPVVAVFVPLVDVLLALPVLIVVLALSGELHASLLLLPLILALQLVLMCGVGWVVAALAAFLNDVKGIVAVGLTLLFYLTPVFYDFGRVPASDAWILRLNPLTTLIQAERSVALHTAFPPAGAMAVVALVSLLIAAGGAALFVRLQPRFVDEL